MSDSPLTDKLKNELTLWMENKRNEFCRQKGISREKFARIAVRALRMEEDNQREDQLHELRITIELLEDILNSIE